MLLMFSDLIVLGEHVFPIAKILLFCETAVVRIAEVIAQKEDFPGGLDRKDTMGA
jgi:hypothetical protein